MGKEFKGLFNTLKNTDLYNNVINDASIPMRMATDESNGTDYTCYIYYKIYEGKVFIFDCNLKNILRST